MHFSNQLLVVLPSNWINFKILLKNQKLIVNQYFYHLKECILIIKLKFQLIMLK